MLPAEDGEFENVRPGPEFGSNALSFSGSTCSWSILLSIEQLEDLRSRDAVASVGSDSGERFAVPLHHADSVDAYMEIAKAYKGREHRWCVCLYRGQTRDYFSAPGDIHCVPAGYRTTEWRARYNSEREALLAELSTWQRVLKDLFRVNTGSGVYYEDSPSDCWPDENEDDHTNTRRLFVDSSPITRVNTNPELAGILQHYGFPTPSLDVTEDPLIALWFAVHRARKDEDGRLRFEPASFDSSVSSTFLPSVYIFLQHPSSRNSRIINLMKAYLAGVAERPFRQRAVLLPFAEHTAFPLPTTGTSMTAATPTPRVPSAIVKIHFGAEQLRRNSPHLTTDWLFPKEERLYRELLGAKAPHLDVYA